MDKKTIVDIKPNDRYYNPVNKKQEASNAGKLLGSIKSEKKAASSKRNGKLGGRPIKNKANTK